MQLNGDIFSFVFDFMLTILFSLNLLFCAGCRFLHQGYK